MITLPPEVKEVLARSTFGADCVTLPEQLDRKMYVKVNQAIELAGGRWDRKRKCHIFGEDPAKVLGVAVETGALDPTAVDIGKVQHVLRPGQQAKIVPDLFETPRSIALQMIQKASIVSGNRVLEPSAGTGKLVKEIFDAAPVWITAIEIMPQLVEAMESQWRTSRIKCVCKDFLQFDESGFDRVIMNPPFSGGQDIRHIRHATSLLAPFGVLVALCANGPRQNEELKPLALESGGSWTVLPRGSFKSAGTMVNVAMMVFNAKG